MSPSKTRRAKAQQKKQLERAQAVLASESWRKQATPQRSLDPPDPEGHRRGSVDDGDPPPMPTYRSADLHDPIGGLSPLTSLIESTRRSDIRGQNSPFLAPLPESRPASEPANDSQNTKQSNRKTMSVGSAPSDERRRVTVETVTDEEDIYRIRSKDQLSSAVSRARNEAKHSRSGSHTSSRKSGLKEGQDKFENLFETMSIYPTMDVIQDYESDEMSDTTRAKRKAGKRRQTPLSVSSRGGHDKSTRAVKNAAVSRDDGWRGDDESDSPLGWDDHKKRLAVFALEHDRSSRARTEEGQRSREAAQVNLCRLRDMRVGEDREVAEELLLRDLQELDDRRLAEQLAAQQDRIDHSKRIAAEQQQKIVAAELQLQAERAKAEEYESVVRKQERRAVHQSSKAVSHSSMLKRDGTPKPSGTPLRKDHDDQSSRAKLDFGNRVILQRYRIADIMKTGQSHVPDQGIQWGADGKPYEARPAMSRDTSVKGDKPSTLKAKSETVPLSAAKSKAEETLGQSLATQAKRELREVLKPNGFYERAGTAPKKRVVLILG
ncbi:hypothetical protein C8J57DRAFT_1676156 [Mycena rebaudengoi]|nr:hypothetical protein C8J57DRAFT_1676156 [Mycena rebaudengoi]